MVSPGTDTGLEFAHAVFMKHRHLGQAWEGGRTRQREKWNFDPTCSEPQPQDVLWGAYDLSEVKSTETQWPSPVSPPQSAMIADHPWKLRLPKRT